jgi:hypothetical protein
MKKFAKRTPRKLGDDDANESELHNGKKSPKPEVAL